jgi:hypothetical protein
MKSVYIEHSVETCKKLIDEASLIPIKKKRKRTCSFGRWRNWDGYHIEVRYASLEDEGYEVLANIIWFAPEQWAREAPLTRWTASCRHIQGKIYLIPQGNGTKLSWKIQLKSTFKFGHYFAVFLLGLGAFFITRHPLFNMLIFGVPMFIFGDWISFISYRREMKIFFKNVFEKMGVPDIRI